VIHDNPEPRDAASADSASSSLSATAPATTPAVEPLLWAPQLGVEPEPGRPPIRLSPLQIAGIIALAVFTIFITWRAKSLEKAIAKRDPASEIVSKTAPGFSLPALDGRTISLSDYAGKKVVVSYWASWCGPCKVEMPELRDFYKRYHKPDSDFEILAISIDENRSDAERYASAESLPFPVLLDTDSKVADSYSVEGIPTMVVIDKSRKVTYAHTGLDQAMQFQLMSQLGIKFPDALGAGKDEKGGADHPVGDTKP
jgi:peroxiredoxin